MVMYSLYCNDRFIGKYVRKDQAINDILNVYQIVNDNYKIYKDDKEEVWNIVKKDKVIWKYEIRKEDV